MATDLGNGTVKVVKGDTLWGIAEKYLGSGTKYPQLATINGISSPYIIYVGQIIKLSASGGSSSSTSTTANTNKPTIVAFGEQSDAENTLFAVWQWDKENTESYKIYWHYETGDGIWFVGSDTSTTVDTHMPSASRQSTYSIPKNAKKVKFKVKPISKKYTKNNTETSYWTASWSDEKTFTVAEEPPAVPSVSVEIEDYKLTATCDNVDEKATGVEFQIVKDNAKTTFKTGKATVTSRHAAYSCNVDAGSEYKVRVRSYKGTTYSEWSEYSNNVDTIPAASAGITVIKTVDKTIVHLEWSPVRNAKSYDIEYTTRKDAFDAGDDTTTVSGITETIRQLTGLETGNEYFFRVRAVNDKGNSAWSGVKSIVVGKKPSAPTTWSSTTTAIVNEPLTLYWVHNSEDGSSQTYASLELTINDGMPFTRDIKNTTDEDEKDKTSFYIIDWSAPEFKTATKIQWRVRTAGITKEYSDWSVQRTIDIYAPPTLEFTLTDIQGNPIETVTAFPFYASGIPGPDTQTPIGYHLTVVSNDAYETTDNVGNERIVNIGEEVYSKYFDTFESLLVEFSAGNIDLENNISYTAKCTVAMNSGLTAESSVEFTVSWTDVGYLPNAEISLDEDTMTTYIRPYCEEVTLKYYWVTEALDVYEKTTMELDPIYGVEVAGVRTTTGEQVYSGMDVEGTELYYCIVEKKNIVEGVTLSVYRREFDGSFTELGIGLSNSKTTTIADPHPALDYARYRIVAITESTGAVCYYDLPGYPVGGKSVIIQWDEDWTNFETTEEDALEQPPWSGSLLKLPYNIDVSDNHQQDVELIEYIGREHPVSYYGTQLGQSSTWNMEIEKSDKETLYALRRLARWMGDVYVREPSGSGYWANITVSFSQKHCEVTIPVTLNITRVEGGA